jgi:hypothetical protein
MLPPAPDLTLGVARTPTGYAAEFVGGSWLGSPRLLDFLHGVDSLLRLQAGAVTLSLRYAIVKALTDA